MSAYRKLMNLIVLCMCAVLVAGCAGSSPPEGGEPETVVADRSIEQIEAAVSDPGRPEEDQDRDVNRKPAELLGFLGITEGMRVVDLMASTGYYTEILSSIVGSEGQVYSQNNAFVLDRFAREPLESRLERLGRDNIILHQAELGELNLPSDLDAALLVRFYHDFYWMPGPDGENGSTDRALFNRQVFAALKSGGLFGVVDHHAEAGSGDRDALDPREGLHRVDAEMVKQEILAAGFVLEAESDLLANPEDTRDWNIFVDEGTKRDTTDRFVYLFRKP
jgi:predicted methyltransferase